MIISGRKMRTRQPSIIEKENKIFVKNRKGGQINDLAKKRDTMNKKLQRKIKTQQIQ